MTIKTLFSCTVVPYGVMLLFGLVVIYGSTIFRNGVNLSKVFFGALGASIIFFLLSNFGVWASTGVYPINLAGLLTCYLAGLPFLLNQVFGDLFYSLVSVWSRTICVPVEAKEDTLHRSPTTSRAYSLPLGIHLISSISSFWPKYLARTKR
jgi:hypothetical protein